MNEHKHTVSKALVICLAKLAKAGGTASLKTVGLSHYQWANFQKLRYWKLIQKPPLEGRTGVWEITSLGRAFLNNECPIQRSVWTYRNVPVRFEGEFIWPGDVIEGYRKYEDYVEDMQAHGGETK